MSLSLSSLSPSVTPLFPTANGAHAFVIGFVDPSSLHLLSHGRVLVAAHHHHIDHGLCMGLGRQMSFAGKAARRLGGSLATPLAAMASRAFCELTATYGARVRREIY